MKPPINGTPPGMPPNASQAKQTVHVPVAQLRDLTPEETSGFLSAGLDPSLYAVAEMQSVQVDMSIGPDGSIVIKPAAVIPKAQMIGGPSRLVARPEEAALAYLLKDLGLVENPGVRMFVKRGQLRKMGPDGQWLEPEGEGEGADGPKA